MFRTLTLFPVQTRFFRPTLVMHKTKDLYEQLGVKRTSSQEDIKGAYFKLAKLYHPDVNPTTAAKERFSQINSAYETLGDSEKRRVYDATGMESDEQ